MEGIIILFILVWVFQMVKKAADKQKQGEASGAAAGSQKQPPKPATAGPVRRDAPKGPIRQDRSREGGGSLEGTGTLGSLHNGLAGYKPLTHRMEETGGRSEYIGSLGVASEEGVDVCDPSLEHGRLAGPVSGGVYEGELGGAPLVDFHARAMMQGIVMSEILTRPSQRKWGRR